MSFVRLALEATVNETEFEKEIREDEKVTSNSNPGAMHIRCFGTDGTGRSRAGSRCGRAQLWRPCSSDQPFRSYRNRDNAVQHGFAIDDEFAQLWHG